MNKRELKFRIWDAQYKRFVKGYENKNHYDELYSDPPGLIFGGLAYLNEYGEYYTVQQFTGLKGELVSIEETIKGFNAIMDGEYDHLPEAAFNLVGTIEQAVAKGEKMLAEAQ